MATLGMIIMVIGWIVMLVFSILFLVRAFKENILWGLGCLVFSPVSLIFLIMHWQEARGPFLGQLGGVALTFLGLLISGEIGQQ